LDLWNKPLRRIHEHDRMRMTAAISAVHHMYHVWQRLAYACIALRMRR